MKVGRVEVYDFVVIFTAAEFEVLKSLAKHYSFTIEHLVKVSIEAGLDKWGNIKDGSEAGNELEGQD